MKRNLNYLCKAVNKNPNNAYLRGSFYKIRKEYRKLIKSSKRKFEQEKIYDLEKNSKDRTLFWKILKDLKKKKEESLPDPDDLQNHFQNLYTEKENNETKNTKSWEETLMKHTELTNRITVDEIKFHIKKSKMKKASGNDGISNEILKNSSEDMFELYKLLFNKIIEEENYPEC